MFIHQEANRVVIGGVRSLQDFNPDSLTVRVKGGSVTVTGSRLEIARLDEDEMEVRGKIENVERSN